MIHVDEALVTIRGLIVPAAWDERGKVTAVAISAFDENEYLVFADEIGEQLLALIHQQVEILAEVRKEVEKEYLKVASYRLKR